MSSEDLPIEVAEQDDFSDLPEFPNEEPVAQPAEEPADDAIEEPIESETEEAPEASEGTDEDSPDDVDGGPDLSQFPEEIQADIRAYAQTYGDQRVSELQSRFTPKLQEAAEQKRMLEEYDRAIKERPDLVIEELKKLAEGSGPEVPQAPPEPGPPPTADDLYDNPEALTQWIAQRDTFNQWQTEQMIAQERMQTQQVLRPLIERNQQVAAIERERYLQQQTEADDETFSEMKTLAETVKGDANAAWKLMKEVVSLRKQVAGKTAAGRRKAAEQVRGSEERPGLPGTGARKQAPLPTGDLAKDVAAELEAEGVAFPDGH